MKNFNYLLSLTTALLLLAFAVCSADSDNHMMPSDLENMNIVGPGGVKLSSATADSLLQIGYHMIQMSDDINNEMTAFVFKEKSDLKGLIPDEIFKQLPDDFGAMDHPPSEEDEHGSPFGGMSFDTKDNKWSGKPMTDFSLTDYEGETVSSEQLRDKVVVVSFWFIACKPCIMEMPDLNKLVAKYKGKDVLFIAPTFDSKSNIDKFFSSTDNKFDYKIIPGAESLIKNMGITSFPTNMIINKEGIVLDVIQGGIPSIDSKLSNIINEALLF